MQYLNKNDEEEKKLIDIEFTQRKAGPDENAIDFGWSKVQEE